MFDKMFVGFLAVLYAVVFWKTVARFYFKTVVPSRWFGGLAHHFVHRWEDNFFGRMGTIVMLICVVLPAGVVGFCMAPFLWIRFRRIDFLAKKEKEKQEKVLRELQEKAERLRVERLAENNRRTEARKQWLSENKPKLYYNTMGGITVVLLPRDYEEVVKQTAINRRNGFWESESVLCPAPNTVVFVTKQGKETVLKSVGRSDSYYKIAGLLSQLDEIVEPGNVELVRDERIFVPWVNETLVSFSEQRRLFRECQHKGTFEKLVEAQAPADLQPL